MQFLRPPGSKIKLILGNRLRIKRLTMKLVGRIFQVHFRGSELDNEPVFEAQIMQVGTKFEHGEYLAVGDKIFVDRHAGIILFDGTILISAHDIVAARPNGKVEKIKATAGVAPEIVDYPPEVLAQVTEKEAEAPCAN